MSLPTYAVTFRGKPACPCLAKWLPAYEAELLRRKVILHNLDIYQLIGGAPQSGGTHTMGGAYDVAQVSDLAIWVARNMGGIAWHRPVNWDGHGGIEHQHGVLNGCPHNGPARYQIDAYKLDFNGLGLNGHGGKDTGPRGIPLRTWEEGMAWAKAQAAPKPVVAAPAKKVAPAPAKPLTPQAQALSAINTASRKVPWHSVIWYRLRNAALTILGKK